MAPYHDMRVHENFEQCATRLVAILRSAEKEHPGAPRRLYLDVQGHRNSAGGFDRDAYEMMNHVVLTVLSPFLTEFSTPLVSAVNRERQRNDVPDAIVVNDPDEGRQSPRDANPVARRTTPSVRQIADYFGLDEPACMICWSTPVERAHARPASLVGSNDVRNFALLCGEHHRTAPDVEDSEGFWRWVDWALDVDGFFARMHPHREPIQGEFFSDIQRQLREIYGWDEGAMTRYDWTQVMRLQYEVLQTRTTRHFGVARKASTYAWAFDQALRQLEAEAPDP